MKLSRYFKITAPLILLTVLVTSKAGKPEAIEFLSKVNLSTIEETEANALFDKLTGNKKFRYRRPGRIDNGACAIRAEAIDDYLKEKQNLRTARVWIRCSLHPNNSIIAIEQTHNKRWVYGNYHVANVVQVRDANGVTKAVVFDPQFQPAPIELEAYLDQVVKNRVNYKNLSLDEATKLHGTTPCMVNLTTYTRDSYIASNSPKFL